MGAEWVQLVLQVYAAGFNRLTGLGLLGAVLSEAATKYTSCGT